MPETDTTDDRPDATVLHIRTIDTVATKVIHIRSMRNGDGTNTVPEASFTDGPVDVAAQEIIDDLVHRCRAVVRRGHTTRLINADGTVVRTEFEVDITLKPGRSNQHDPGTYTWDHVITRPADPYRRLDRR